MSIDLSIDLSTYPPIISQYISRHRTEYVLFDCVFSNWETSRIWYGLDREHATETIFNEIAGIFFRRHIGYNEPTGGFHPDGSNSSNLSHYKSLVSVCKRYLFNQFRSTKRWMTY